MYGYFYLMTEKALVFFCIIFLVPLVLNTLAIFYTTLYIMLYQYNSRNKIIRVRRPARTVAVTNPPRTVYCTPVAVLLEYGMYSKSTVLLYCTVDEYKYCNLQYTY